MPFRKLPLSKKTLDFWTWGLGLVLHLATLPEKKISQLSASQVFFFQFDF